MGFKIQHTWLVCFAVLLQHTISSQAFRCNENPCRHGTCKAPRGRQHYCICESGYTGRDCSARRSLTKTLVTCGSLTCQNGAVCQQTPRCTCPPGYTGTECETQIDDCAAKPCKNNGVCVDGVNTYTCRCPAQWTGPNCDVDVDECSLGLNLCQNGATCQNDPGSYHCSCVSGWTGADCGVNVDDCKLSCFHGATCRYHGGTITCECPPGKMGILCHLNDGCAVGTPCLNGGTCNPNPVTGFATCTCLSGWTGSDCSQDVDE